MTVVIDVIELSFVVHTVRVRSGAFS